jgi:exosortase
MSDAVATTPANGYIDRRHIPLAIAVLIAMVVAYRFYGRELYLNWNMRNSYYSHGFLVPFVSLFFAWRNRAAFLAAEAKPSPWGYLWMAGAAALLLLADFLGFRVLGQVSLVVMIVGVLLVIMGVQRTLTLWFPLAFLLFMVPIPASLTASITFRLKLIASEAAVGLCNLLTMPVVQDGSYIHFKDDYLVVGEVCGGLRSLIALFALGAIIVYVSKCKTWARVVLLLLTGPIAIIANIFRIFLLCVVGYLYGSEVASGKVHDFSGYLIFVVAFGLFFIAEAVLRRLALEREPAGGAA